LVFERETRVQKAYAGMYHFYNKCRKSSDYIHLPDNEIIKTEYKYNEKETA